MCFCRHMMEGMVSVITSLYVLLASYDGGVWLMCDNIVICAFVVI